MWVEKQRTITPSHPPVDAPGGVADDIRLGLNNTTAGDAFGRLPHQDLANQIAGERDRINRQLRTSERPIALAAARGLATYRRTLNQVSCGNVIR